MSQSKSVIQIDQSRDVEPSKKVDVPSDFSGIDQAILSRHVEIAFGRNKEDKHWKVRAESYGKLLAAQIYGAQEGAHQIGMPVGPKDGPCILQGALVADQRLAKNVSRNCLIMVDCDTGHSIDDLAKIIEDHGLFALLWNTHSHLKPKTRISEAALLKWMKAHGRDKPDVETVREYLRTEKRYKTQVADSVSNIERLHTDRGVTFEATHAPLHRVRIQFVLEEDFEFAKRGTHNEAIREWKERYAGFCEKLGLPYDASCCDPARLMYLPRVPVGADAALYGFRICPGRALAIEEMPRKTTRCATAAGSSGASNGCFKTPGLRTFLAKCAPYFEAADFVEERAPHLVVSGNGSGKVRCTCPNSSAHSETDDGFFAENASARESGFQMHCSHESCKQESHGDRAWYLDLVCQECGVTHADELIEWCPTEAIQATDPIPSCNAREGGREWIKRMQAPPETMAMLDEMNERHAFIVYGGKTRFLCVTENAREYELPYQFLDEQTFQNMYSDTPDVRLIKRKLRGGADPDDPNAWENEDVWKSRVWAWNSWPGRRKFTRIGFFPNQTPPMGAFNIWEGWRIAPKKGCWKQTLKHIYVVICCSDPDKFRYVIDWLSHLIQTTGRPEERSPVSLFVWGQHGSGKSIVFDHIAKLFGNHGITLNRSEELTGTFNKHLMTGCFVVCEEAVYGNDKKAASTLKDILTRRTMNVHPKNVDMFTAPNFLRCVFVGNDPNNIPMTVGERRYEVFHVSPRQIDDAAWFDRIIDELNNRDGLAAMLYDLQNRKYDKNLIKRLMKENKDRDNSKSRVLEPPIRFALEWIAHGSVTLRSYDTLPPECKESPKDSTPRQRQTLADLGGGEHRGCLRLMERHNRAPSADIKRAYDEWCESRLNQYERRHCQRAQSQLTKEIREALPFIKKYRSSAERGLEFPPLKECLDAVRQLPVPWAYVQALDVDEDPSE